MRPFALRQRRADLSTEPPRPGQRSWPASSKRFRNLRPDPFGSALPSPSGFLSPRGARSTHETRCQVRSRNSLPVFRPPLPSRTSRSLRDRSAQPDSKRRSLPLRVARSSFAPRRARNNFLSTCATDHRSRSATSRQARCPSNLLEPYSSCTRTTFQSSENERSTGFPSRIYLSCNQ